MGKLNDNYRELAMATGLQYDQRFNILYGQKRGYDILVYAPDNRYPYMLTIQTAARNATNSRLSSGEKREIVKGVDKIASMNQKDYTLTFQQKNIGNQEKLKVALANSIDGIISGLREKAMNPCCSYCGKSEPTQPFKLGAQKMQICAGCQGLLHDNAHRDALIYEQKEDNVLLGTIGALIGSLLGVLCIVLLGQAGYVAVLSGIAMAWGVIKGYELLGKKLSTKGAWICIIIMVVMTYVGDRIDWAIHLGGDLLVSLRRFSFLLKRGTIDMATYIFNLVLLYIFTAFGAFPIIKDAMVDRRVRYELIKLENTYF